MSVKDIAARRIFIRYVLLNLLLFMIPLALSLLSSGVSLRVIWEDVNAIADSQLSRSMAEIDGELAGIRRMSIQLSNDYTIGYYLSNRGPISGIDFYNLKGVSDKLSAYVLNSGLLSHAFLYMDRAGVIVSESGFSTYESFYGPLFSSEGFTAGQWRDQVLRSSGGEHFFFRQKTVMAGQSAASHLYCRAIGYGDYYLGAIVAVIDEERLARMLADLPRAYGGWVLVEDESGAPIASTGADKHWAEELSVRARGADILRDKGQTFRLYRMRAPESGWQYTAVLNETRILSGVRTVRIIMSLLLGGGLLIGLCVSYLVAFAESRPLRRITRLLLGNDRVPVGAKVSAFQQLEQAVVALSDSKMRLERELTHAGPIARTHFFQSLLRGDYRTRSGFLHDRELFRIGLEPSPSYVVVCRLAALAAAPDAGSFEYLRRQLGESAVRRTGPHDFIVPMSFDDLAIVRVLDPSREYRADGAELVQSISGDISHGIRGDFSFGIGAPVDNPFLLAISYNQAVTAVSSLAPFYEAPCRFYEDMPGSRDSYSFPLEIEEQIVRAVRSANADILNRLLCSVREENFIRRTLNPEDARNLQLALRGTCVRLCADLPGDQTGIKRLIADWCARPPAAESFAALEAILRGISRQFDRIKRSHNVTLLESLQKYILENYTRPDLGLTLISQALGRTENYISNFYKDQTGELLSEAIQRIRFDRAAGLLRETGLSVDRIAASCGYVNTTSFRRAFKRVKGISPSEYKARMADG